MKEMFGAGTACVVCPVNRILFQDEVGQLGMVLTNVRPENISRTRVLKHSCAHAENTKCVRVIVRVLHLMKAFEVETFCPLYVYTAVLYKICSKSMSVARMSLRTYHLTDFNYRQHITNLTYYLAMVAGPLTDLRPYLVLIIVTTIIYMLSMVTASSVSNNIRCIGK